MSPKTKSPADDKVALYDKLLATNPKIERKGDANPYTSLNGNMFTLLHQNRLAIRLPEAERERFLKKYKTTLFEAYGAVMRNTWRFRTSCSRTQENCRSIWMRVTNTRRHSSQSQRRKNTDLKKH